MLAYASRSKGAQRLAEALGLPLITRGEAFDRTHTILNWGNSSSNLPDNVRGYEDWLNEPTAVDNSVDKTATFKALDSAGIPCIASTDKSSHAMKWLEGGEAVMARHDLRGMQGKGLVVIRDPKEFEFAPLYTLYVEHNAEVRVHVVNNEVVEILDKTANGFVSQAIGGEYTIDRELLSSLAIEVIKELRLDFGAVDFLWTNNPRFEGEEAVVVEVNTSPEMKDGTLEAYATAFRSHYGIVPVVDTAQEKVEAILEDANMGKSVQNGKTSNVDAKTSPVAPVSESSGKTTGKVAPEAPVVDSGKTSGKTSGKVSEEAPILPAETEEAVDEERLRFVLKQIYKLTDEIEAYAKEAEALIA